MLTGHGLTRLVTVTGSGAMLPGEHVTGYHAIKRAQMNRGAPHLLADGDDHPAVLAESDLDWTAIRVPVMTRAHTDTDEHTISKVAFHPTSMLPYRAAATAMLDLTDTGSWSRSSPFAAAHPAAIARRPPSGKPNITQTAHRLP